MNFAHLHIVLNHVPSLQRNVGKASKELDSRMKVESADCSKNSSNPMTSSTSNVQIT